MMNLYSCGCGVVLDLDKIKFPEAECLWKEQDSANYDLEEVVFDEHYGWRAYTKCPVCKTKILEPLYYRADKERS